MGRRRACLICGRESTAPCNSVKNAKECSNMELNRMLYKVLLYKGGYVSERQEADLADTIIQPSRDTYVFLSEMDVRRLLFRSIEGPQMVNS